MKVFGYISNHNETGYLLKLLRQDGALIQALEIKRQDKIEEIGRKFVHDGDEFVMLASPWQNSEFKIAADNYSDQYGCSLKGYCS